MTIGFMLIFTIITIGMGCWGMVLTKRRDLPGWIFINYGFCLLFFIIIPLFVVGGGSRMALSMSDQRLMGICAIGKNTF
jgi:hypothetical protein